MSIWAICRHRASVQLGVFSLALSVIAADLTLATAQTVTATAGAVNGIVTDSTRAVVPGVLVSLSGPSLLTSVTMDHRPDGGVPFLCRAAW